MILVAYASKHGATQGIARFIAERLIERGETAEARSVTEIEALGEPEAVILGSAVYAGSWRKEAVDFVDAHGDELARLPVWLFSSGPLGDQVVDEEEQPRELVDLRERISPRSHQMFFGALDQSEDYELRRTDDREGGAGARRGLPQLGRRRSLGGRDRRLPPCRSRSGLKPHGSELGWGLSSKLGADR